MERVAFLIEDTHVRLGCLLNPEALVMRRMAGIQPRRITTGQVTGVGLSDDPLLYTGGGRTELDLDLLFDVSLAGSSITTVDVRDLTRTFWDLAENAPQDEMYGHPPLVRFIWGKTWNIPGYIVAVAERLEYFTAEGTPRRSWLRMRMVRANEPTVLRRGVARPPEGVISLGDVALPEGSLRVHQISGGTSGAAATLGLAAPSLGSALLTAADIIGAALANTNAARLLAAARKGITGAVQSLGARIGSLFSGEGRVGQVVRSALSHISSALASAWSAAKEQTVQALSAAAAAIAGATRRLWGALRDAVTPLGAAIAAEMSGAVQSIRRGVGTIGQAVATVARAARAEATRIAAVASKRIEAAVGRVRSLLDRAATVAADVAQSLREALAPAIEDIGGVLSAARLAGTIVTAAMVRTISTRMQQLAAGVESLWSSGKATLARGLESAVRAVAQALHSTSAARETLGAVDIRESTVVLKTAIERTKKHIAAFRASRGEEEQAESLRDQLAEVRAAADIVHLAADAHEPPWNDALPALDAASDLLTTPQSEEATATIESQLEAIVEGIPSVEEFHEQSLANAMSDAYAAADAAMPEAPTGEIEAAGETLAQVIHPEALGSRTISGQRLDQLAYQYYGDAAFWRLLALFNDVDHPLHLPTGLVLRVPPSSVVRRASDSGTASSGRTEAG